jgi:hypothetical protein
VSGWRGWLRGKRMVPKTQFCMICSHANIKYKLIVDWIWIKIIKIWPNDIFAFNFIIRNLMFKSKFNFDDWYKIVAFLNSNNFHMGWHHHHPFGSLCSIAWQTVFCRYCDTTGAFDTTVVMAMAASAVDVLVKWIWWWSWISFEDSFGKTTSHVFVRIMYEVKCPRCPWSSWLFEITL